MQAQAQAPQINRFNLKLQVPDVYEPMFVRNKYRFKMLSGGRGSGKSWGAGDAAVTLSLQEPLRILCAREVQRSINQSVKQVLDGIIDDNGLREYFKSTKDKITSVLGSEFHFVGLQDVFNIKSFEKFDIIWVEEAERISHEKWKLITPTIRRPGSEIWATWNPLTEYDPVMERFCKNIQPDTFYKHTTFEDNPWFPEVLEAERLRCLRENPEDYDWIWLGKPLSKSGFKVFISADLVRASQDNYKTWADVEYAPKILGVDPARFGDDEAVIVLRQGLKAEEVKVLSKIDNMQLAAHVIECIKTYKPEAVFIDAGRGEGVIDRCRQLGYDVIEVNFSQASTRPQTYRNKRVEMYAEVKQWMKDGGNIPKKQEWYRECTATEYGHDEQNRVVLEKKDKVKERIGVSPGRMDALALTFAIPVSTESDVEHRRNYEVKVDYDPYKY